MNELVSLELQRRSISKDTQRHLALQFPLNPSKRWAVCMWGRIRARLHGGRKAGRKGGENVNNKKKLSQEEENIMAMERHRIKKEKEPGVTCFQLG